MRRERHNQRNEGKVEAVFTSMPSVASTTAAALLGIIVLGGCSFRNYDYLGRKADEIVNVAGEGNGATGGTTSGGGTGGAGTGGSGARPPVGGTGGTTTNPGCENLVGPEWSFAEETSKDQPCWQCPGCKTPDLAKPTWVGEGILIGLKVPIPQSGKAGVTEVFFKHAFGKPTDLTGKVITYTVGSTPQKPQVLTKAYVHSSGSTLKWGDGGEKAIASGLEEVTVNPELPAWSETGYDPTKAEVVGLSLKANDGPSELTISSVTITEPE
jgi:hypothetical protein